MTARNLPIPRWTGLRPLALAAPLLAALAAPIARGQEPSRLESLNVFVLVDVSRSMYLDDAQFEAEKRGIALAGPPAGSDPGRQRWDAVRLLLNLLTDDDRVAILPFNDKAPAIYPFGNAPVYYVPGAVADEPRSPRDGEDRLGRWVESFAYSGDSPAVGQSGQVFWINRDIGGTGIFLALREARARSLRAGGEASRKPVIVLLTDGDDQSLPPDERERVNRDEAALLAQIVGEGTGDQTVPVYTIGLGGQVKDDLLTRIARLTGGSYRKIGPVTDLVPTFRELVWSLKYCWIKSPGPGDRRSVEGLEGILDFGVLSSRGRPPGPFSREARPPAPPPSVGDADFASYEGRRRSGNQERDHLYEYFYFGPRRPADRLISVDWSGDPPELVRTVGFSKRTARPLFTLVEPAPLAEVGRLERIGIRVQFNPTEPFRSEDFRLWYSVRPAGSEASTVRLSPTEADRRVEAVAPRSATPVRRYTVRIEAEGVGDPRTHPLSGYRLVLPERTIEVGDVLRLRADPSAVKLTEKARQARVTIRGGRPIDGELKLAYRLEPPIRKGATAGEDRPIHPDALQIRPRLGAADAREVVFQDDAAELELTLDSGPHQPPLGAEYGPGTLVVSTKPETGVPAAEVRIPVQLQLRPASLVIAPPGPIRVVYGKEDDPPPPRLRVVEDGGLGPVAGRVTSVVELRHLQGDAFSADELWLEPADANAPAARSRSLTLPLGREFLVRFRPRQHFGRHEYQIEARLSGADERQAVPVRVPVAVEYEFPRLTLAEPVVAARVPRGEIRRLTIRPSIRGPKGLRRPVLLRAASSQEDDRYVRIDQDEKPVVVEAGSTAPLVFGVGVAPDAPLRKYTLKAFIVDAGGESREAEATVEVVVDELRVTDRTLVGSEVGRAIPVELWVGSPHVHRLEVKTALSGALPGPLRAAGDGGPKGSPGPSAIRAEVDARDDGGFSLLPRRTTLRSAVDDPSGRTLLVEFPPINNVEPNRTYRVFLDLVPDPATGLPRKLLEFEVRYRRTNQLAPLAP